MPCSAKSSRSRKRADALDLGQVDERLDRLALAEVEAERESVLAAVLVVEPEAEQSLAGRRSTPRIALRAPRVDAPRARR